MIMLLPFISLANIPAQGLYVPQANIQFINYQLAQLPPKGSSEAMDFFNKELDRAERLYNELMFEEADRVADMTIARINAFIQNNQSIEGAKEIEAVYLSRVEQLRRLKDYKSFDRTLMLQEGAMRFDAKKSERERKLREQREHNYKLAVEARRTAEAHAARWWSRWYGRPYSSIIIYD